MYAQGDLLTKKLNRMTELEIANMLADYHKECDAADELGDKGRIQLKHARKIMQALRIQDVVGRSEQLKAVEKLKDFAYEVCPLHREDDLEEIVGSL